MFYTTECLLKFTAGEQVVFLSWDLSWDFHKAWGALHSREDGAVPTVNEMQALGANPTAVFCLVDAEKRMGLR